MDLLRFEPAGAIAAGTVTADDLSALAEPLESARQEVLADAQLWADDGDVPAAKKPLDAGFHYLPNRLLGRDTVGGMDDSDLLARIEESAAELRNQLDSLLVLGIGGSYMGARAIFEALCHPYHNLLSREQRQGIPRILFEGNNVDNDTIGPLREMLIAGDADKVQDRWGMVVISKSGGTLETAAAFRVFRAAFDAFYAHDAAARRDLVIPITGATNSKLRDLSDALDYCQRYPVPDGVGGRFSVLSPVGLFPAACAGVDVRQMLEGAAAMNEHFATAAPEENVVLQFVAAAYHLEKSAGCNIRVLSTWGNRLEAVGLWYDQLLAESLGKHEKGATPLTVVNTRDLHSRGQQHQEGRRDKLITNLYVEETQQPPIALPSSEEDQDQLNEIAGKTIPQILTAARKGTDQAYQEVQRPTVDLVMPKLDAATLGQAFQLFMLATVVEGRLIGINPYGQPGVEAYKKNMNALLRS